MVYESIIGRSLGNVHAGQPCPLLPTLTAHRASTSTPSSCASSRSSSDTSESTASSRSCPASTNCTSCAASTAPPSAAGREGGQAAGGEIIDGMFAGEEVYMVCQRATRRFCICCWQARSARQAVAAGGAACVRCRQAACCTASPLPPSSLTLARSQDDSLVVQPLVPALQLQRLVGDGLDVQLVPTARQALQKAAVALLHRWVVQQHQHPLLACHRTAVWPPAGALPGAPWPAVIPSIPLWVPRSRDRRQRGRHQVAPNTTPSCDTPIAPISSRA